MAAHLKAAFTAAARGNLPLPRGWACPLSIHPASGRPGQPHSRTPRARFVCCPALGSYLLAALMCSRTVYCGGSLTHGVPGVV